MSNILAIEQKKRELIRNKSWIINDIYNVVDSKSEFIVDTEEE